MNKDPLRVVETEAEVEPCLLLWAHALVRGVRDFTEAERKRAALEELIDSQEGAKLRTLLANFHKIAAERRALMAMPRPRLPKEIKAREKLINDKAKLLRSSIYADVIVFLGLDEPTEWFWSDDQGPGSIRAIYSLFQGFPKLSEFRSFIVNNAPKMEKFKWGGIDGETPDEK